MSRVWRVEARTSAGRRGQLEQGMMCFQVGASWYFVFKQLTNDKSAFVYTKMLPANRKLAENLN